MLTKSLTMHPIRIKYSISFTVVATKQVLCSFLLDVPPVTKNKVKRVQGRPAPHVQGVVAQVEKQWQIPEKCHKLRLCAGMSNT